jgi:small nuclear ribonucleoprotein (snRNP)-like protein
MLFYSFFKTLVGQEVVIELKNGININGSLLSVDQYLNVKLQNISVKEPEKYPQLACLKTCFIRGSVIRYYLMYRQSYINGFLIIYLCRYIVLPKDAVDTDLLQDAARKENAPK